MDNRVGVELASTPPAHQGVQLDAPTRAKKVGTGLVPVRIRTRWSGRPTRSEEE